MEIKAVGITYKGPDGSVGLIMEDDMPEDCVVVFMSKKDYEELKELIK